MSQFTLRCLHNNLYFDEIVRLVDSDLFDYIENASLQQNR